jgi:hypothetical protein
MLLFTHTQVKSMDYLLENKMIIIGIVVSVLFVGYQYFAPYWFKVYKNENNTPYSRGKIIDNMHKQLSITKHISLVDRQINTIHINGSGELLLSKVKKDEKEYIAITADKKILDAFQLKIEDTCVYWGDESENLLRNAQCSYHIGLRDISKIVLNGSVKACFKTDIISRSLSIHVRDNAKMISLEHDIKVIELEIFCCENGCIELKGCASHQDICLMDDASYKGLRVKSKDAKVSMYDASYAVLCLEHHDNGKGRKLQSTLYGIVCDESSLGYSGNPRTTELTNRSRI